MTHNDRSVSSDPLALAEAVAAGSLSQAAAEAILRAAHGSDARRADANVAEMRDLLGAIRGVRGHAEAYERSAGLATLATTGAATDRQAVAPRPVVRGPVGPGRRSSGRSPWGVPGLLAAAAVLLVAIAVGSNLATSPVAATPSPSPSGPVAIASGSPPPSEASPTGVSPSSAAPNTPPATASTAPTQSVTNGAPPVPLASLPGAPGVAFWTLTAEDRITVSEWQPDGSAPSISFTASTWPDPARGDGIWIDRRVVTSPDGRFVAFAETQTQPPGRQRLRVFSATGKMLWSDPAPIGLPDLAWSADGSMLAIGQQPGMWRIVTFGAGSPTVASFDLGGAYALLGFSSSGHTLYGYDSTGDADFWASPVTFPRTGGTVKSIAKFSGRSDPLATSNGTTPTSMLDPENGSTHQPGVDPKSGHVLDRGGASGVGDWELRDGTTTTRLWSGANGSIALAWGPDGTIVEFEPASADSQLSLTSRSASSSFAIVSTATVAIMGTYWQEFDGMRGSVALVGLGADRAHDSLYLGADELLAVDLSTGAATGFAPGAPGLTGLHIAGWIVAAPS